jgi:hypothetical protein
MGRAKDTLMVVRCLHCLTGIEFIPMIAYKDGRFVCGTVLTRCVPACLSTGAPAAHA